MKNKISKAGGNHLAGGAVPIQGEGELGSAGNGADLLLTHVVRPAVAVNALSAVHGGQCQDCPVELVSVVVVVNARPHNNLKVFK